MKSIRFSLQCKAAAFIAAAGLLLCCNKAIETPDSPKPTPDPAPDPTPEEVDPTPAQGISNQFQYNSAALIDIRSVICTNDSKAQTEEVFLSPREGISTVEGVLETDDYLYLKCAYPDETGAVDTTKTFELTYGNFTINDRTFTGKEHKVKVTFSVSSKSAWQTSVLDGVTISIDYINTPSEYIFARYSGEVYVCTPLVELSNQMILSENEEAIVPLKSAVCLIHETFDLNSWYIYSEEGVTAYDEDKSYALLVTAPGKDETFDLSKTSGSYNVRAAGWDSAASGVATLKAEKNSLTVAVDGEDTEGVTLRADYEGSVRYEYACDNAFSQPDGEAVEISKIFRETYGTATYYFAFGSNAAAETPADLTSGDYALFLEVPQSVLDAQIDKDNFTFPEGFKAMLYDYKTYSTYTWSASDADANSIFVLRSEPNGGSDKLYIRYNLIFKDAAGENINVYMTGYLNIVNANIPDLTPVKPYESKITITSPDGETLLDWTITEMQLRHYTSKSTTDIKDFIGEKIGNGYAFYFVSSRTESNGGVDEAYGTPVFTLPKTKVNTLDNYQLNDNSTIWGFNFMNSNLSQTDGVYANSVYAATKYGIWRCPDDARLTVTQDGKNWVFKFVMTDWGTFGSSTDYSTIPMTAPTKLTGTKNVLTIEWRGPATKYTGTKKNDLTDEDY